MSDVVLDNEGFHLLLPTYSELWKKTNYLTKETQVINRIYEYDIKSANTSALRNARRLRVETLNELEQLSKHDREVHIGKMISQDKSIGKTIKHEISRAKRQLFMANGIQDDEILSIKNDAIFVIGRRLTKTEFGSMVFKEKNVYAGYLTFDKLELYYDRKNGTVDIKGIRDDILADKDHQFGMIQFLRQVMEYLVMDRRQALTDYLIQFSDDYKNKRLPVQYYKEMNGHNIYRMGSVYVGFTFQMKVATDEDKPEISGVYNYMRFVLPMIHRFV